MAAGATWLMLLPMMWPLLLCITRGGLREIDLWGQAAQILSCLGLTGRCGLFFFPTGNAAGIERKQTGPWNPNEKINQTAGYCPGNSPRCCKNKTNSEKRGRPRLLCFVQDFA